MKKLYHGSSIYNINQIIRFGFKKHKHTLNIDCKGYQIKINAVFITPDLDIAHIYESDKKGKIIEMELKQEIKILDLTNETNQNIIKEYLKTSSIENYLLENNYKGVKQIHKNDFGKNRIEIAIIDPTILKIVNVRKIKFMELYNIAMEE